MISFSQDIDDEEDNWNECIISCTMLINTAQLLLQQVVELENEHEEDAE